MGLGSYGTGKVYVQVYNGTLVIRAKEDTPGAVSRVLAAGINQGKMIFETQHPFIEGKITGLSYEVKDFGAFIKIEIDDKYVLSVPFQSSMKRNIVSQLPNVNFALHVKIDCFLDKQNAKKNVLLIKQNGAGVAFAYTKVSPNGMPEPVEIVKLGEKKLDYTKVEEFFYDALQKQITRYNTENGVEVDEPDASDF